MPETLQIKRLTLDATLPTRASPGSVGYDLYSLNDLVIQPNSRDIVSTGVCATIPMGILQSTGTQTDYVVSMWITSLVYFLVSYLKENKIIYIYGFAASLSLAILTKQTAYIFALPFCIWLCIYILKSNPKIVKNFNDF